MFTWNFQYVSKGRLSDALNQLMLNAQKGEVLIRIHTAIHRAEEAVDLARFVKNLVPRAKIVGTSTSAVINWGKLDRNQCVISVTQMDDCRTYSVMLPVLSKNQVTPVKAKDLMKKVKQSIALQDAKMLLVFATKDYFEISDFVDQWNLEMGEVPMIGGITTAPMNSLKKGLEQGYVFDENGWSDHAVIIASICGDSAEGITSYASGVMPGGNEMEITEAEGNRIISIDGKDAVQEYLLGASENVKKHSGITSLLPFVNVANGNVPMNVFLSEGKLYANYNVKTGTRIKRSFIHDRNVIAENRLMLGQIMDFKKAETIWGYLGASRLSRYPNCAKWELSAYENSNMCGCVTDGEFAFIDGKNVFSDCSFVAAAYGEKEFTQDFNPYVFSHADSLSEDNQELIKYLMELEKKYEEDQSQTVDASLKSFLMDCEHKLFNSENEDVPNEAALNVDVKLKGYDRICIINVLDVSSMKLVFSDQMIQLTYKNFIGKCMNFAKEKKYRFYVLDQWQVAIGAPSYVISLADFSQDMEKLYKELFAASEEFIAIVPIFCVIYNSTVENLSSSYHSARVEMMNKNIQFLVRDANEERLDEASIRKKYEMVNVINYAISHDAVIPYYQGIYDNKRQSIHHYEALMRLRDENGIIYLPKDFLNVARSFGLMYDSLSLIMIKKVFERFKDEEDKSVSINLGIRDVKNPDVLELIYDTLSTMKHPKNFTFEILENEDIDDYNILIAFVDKIHELGGMISIDDFGSGYSNLQHILSIHSDYVKIDGSIVRNCCVDKESENLIALITGWKSLSERNVKIVAEFVESEDIQRKLTIYGVDFSQGYLFSRPSPTF